MRGIRSRLRRAAQWVVDSVMGNGLAQQETAVEGETETSTEVARLARQAAAEGCVLLHNDGTLPLAKDRQVAVFGRCQYDWFFMGHGSGGDVHPPYRVNLVEGLRSHDACFDRVLAETYRAWCTSEEHAADHGWWGHWPTCLPEMPITDELAQAAAHTSETAVVVVGRTAGEDLDLPLAPGGHYLSDDERALLDAVTKAFARTVVVLNVSNAIDLSWLDDYGDRISAILIAWQGGMEAGNAVADILYGDANPSGRLACTIARRYEDYPSRMTFGTGKTVEYREGVFMGYRHFATYAPNAIRFPFGHGLSYTTFAQEPAGFEAGRNGKIRAVVTVTNTGDRSGREVVQLWCVPPTGAIEKPTRVLAGFSSSQVLEPGERQQVTVSCSVHDVASYDETTHAFVLEEGRYRFEAGDVHVGDWDVPRRRVVEQCEAICQPSDQLRERILERLPSEVPQQSGSLSQIDLHDVANGKASIDEFVARLDDNELEALTRGEGAMNSRLGVAGNAGAFGGITQNLRDLGVPAAICADGPSGARLQRHASLLPCATALACTWDTDLIERLYAATGREVGSAGVDVLLAPGMNLQRDPRCGRNFEYFSEDPLITGRMATAVVRGLQSAGVSACCKHLACNNQERRRNTSDSHVSERALRELYLRGFQICVQEARPDLVMTSYNLVNGVWAHYHYDLVTSVLRGEWGFSGVVITDWWMKPARSPEFPELRNNAYRIRAGVDVLMPGSMSHVLPVRARPRHITRAELQRTARHVLSYLVGRMKASQQEERTV